MPDPNLEKLIKKSLLQMVKNSVGSKAYNSLFVLDKSNNIEIDVFNDGCLSCASFVSCILAIFGLIDGPHATVETVINNLTADYGWTETMILSPGNVILWEEIGCDDETNNEHLGFAISSEEAVSTSSKNKKVTRHHITYGIKKDGTPVRKIVRIYKNIKI